MRMIHCTSRTALAARALPGGVVLAGCASPRTGTPYNKWHLCGIIGCLRGPAWDMPHAAWRGRPEEAS